MRVLSVRKPYAHLIIMGLKPFENRTWWTNHRGPLLIHAGGRWHADPVEEIERRFGIAISPELALGGIVGIANLTAIVTASDHLSFEGPFGWKMDNARALPFVPLRGMQGLFNASHPEALIEPTS
jgi:hypothetical protein